MASAGIAKRNQNRKSHRNQEWQSKRRRPCHAIHDKKTCTKKIKSHADKKRFGYGTKAGHIPNPTNLSEQNVQHTTTTRTMQQPMRKKPKTDATYEVWLFHSSNILGPTYQYKVQNLVKTCLVVLPPFPNSLAATCSLTYRISSGRVTYGCSTDSFS